MNTDDDDIRAGEKPIAICCICHTGLYNGEPYARTADGFAHRFRHTCEYEMNRVAERDRQLLRSMGIAV